jgi:hypothetical protein
MFLAERYQRFLPRAGSNGVIVLDNRRRRSVSAPAACSSHSNATAPRMSSDRIVDSLLLGPSITRSDLRIADLVASTLAARRGQGDASRWQKRLVPLFATHPDTGPSSASASSTCPREGQGAAAKLTVHDLSG